MTAIIEIKNVGKSYNISGRKKGYVTLRDTLTESFKRPFETLKKIINFILLRDNREIFWALKDVNFTIEKGEAIGIIGANGAGKSTLLKILSRITPPTEGEIIINGKIASLLEVGTGFHPELTGRENVFLNGAILGMSRSEIINKFDAIVDFAGIGDFIDTPVKRYSTGMFVRLAFSIAAHIEPDILLVDEVLAVGDAEFQKKCLGKMEEVTGTAGRTILFVSHNMAAVEKLCTKSILLRKGKVVMMGNTKDVIENYLKYEHDKSIDQVYKFPIEREIVRIHNFTISQNGIKTDNIDPDKTFDVGIDFETLSDLKEFRVGVHVKNGLGDVLFRSLLSDWHPELEKIKKGRYKTTLTFPEKLLSQGNYFISMSMNQFGRLNCMDKGPIERGVVVGQSAYYNQGHPTEKADAMLLLNKEWKLESI